MTPSALITAVQQYVGAESDDRWSQAELLTYIHICSQEMANRCLCIQSSTTATSTTGTSGYTMPSNALEVYRILFNGYKLQRIDMRTYDSFVGGDTANPATGTPGYYYIWNRIAYLYPVPTTAQTIKWYTYDNATLPTISSTLDIPVEYHWVLTFGVAAIMLPKDTGDPRFSIYHQKWLDGLEWVTRRERLRKRADSFATVKNEDDMITSYTGVI